MADQPITVAIKRHVDPLRITEATSWTQAGAALVGRQPGVRRLLRPWLTRP